MIQVVAILSLCVLSVPAFADIAIATRNIRPGEVFQSADVLMVRGDAAGAIANATDVIGTEAKVAIFAGRTILQSQLTNAASVQRNQIVEIVFTRGGLSMTTEGRALGRGSVGQRIRVMNLTSKTSVFGTIERDGTVRVTQ